ncbi:response regulator [Alloacidobacterium dinghuense]|uniref:Response regulator n=1 Tax=Alloacidobacterium dinghuense TaxID=2763107 RepID=A0A7G8BEB4_9BACT|nr:response regulator [Alloacidobacterium dinghuense]QNI30884.1 response regulator [Alloacidobacterium dinghuense]
MAGRQPRILCLDDQPANLLVRKMLLEQFGCEVVTVLDAQSCLAAATHEPFDLALIDCHLGETVTGEDVARDLRVCVPGLVLVMLTGDPQIPESAKKSVDAVLIKGSTNPEDLLRTMQELLPDCAIRQPRQTLVRELFPTANPEF